MPLEKHRRSTYVHWDSTEPDQWERLANLLDSLGMDGTITFSDSASLDAFARLRVSNPVTLFDSQLQYNKHRIHWEEKITNTSGNAGSSHSTNMSEAELYVEASDTIIRQSRHYIRYQPGKSQLVFITFVMDSANAELSQRVGYFDNDNGIFFQSDSGYSIVRRSNVTGTPVDAEIAQASWNIDSFDGTGPSGKTLDFTKAQIFFIDVEWLGVGRVRTGFVVDGIPYYAHQFLHANVVSSVYMTTANLPIRYEISATASLVGGKTLQTICSSVMSEGGVHIATRDPFSASNETSLRSVTSASYLPLVAIRPRLSFGGIVNRGRILPGTIGVYSASQPIHYDVYWGANVVGGTWNYVNEDSITEYNVGGVSIYGGISVSSGYVPASVQSKGLAEIENTSDYPMFLNIDGNHPLSPYTDQFVVSARAVGTSSNCGASIDILEIR